MIDFKLYWVTHRKLSPEKSLLKILEEVLQFGVKAVQLREKDLSDKELLSLAKEVRKLTHEYNAYYFINDRLDILTSTQADGIQCPEEGLPVKMATSLFPEKLVGASVHSLKNALEAEKNEADFILFGPIFHTPFKEGILKPQGLQKLKEVTSFVKIPVFAIGGITPLQVKPCLEHGAFGVAVMSALMQTTDMQSLLFSFKKELGVL